MAGMLFQSRSPKTDADFFRAGWYQSAWKGLTCVAFTVFLAQAGSAFAADLSQAVVRQKVNVVTVANSLSAAPRPAAQGSIVRDENVVRTGTESRAELEFSDLTLARLGANSIFSFDAQARALNCSQGAALFSKPSGSGRVEVRAGAITAAITGSTGFISNQPMARAKGRRGPVTEYDRVTMIGMLEGKLRGNALWRDKNGQERVFRFALGSGEMIVAQGGKQPVVVQFDVPRFLRTSPLITGFRSELPNEARLNRAIAEYQSDERRGFVQATNVMVSSQPMQVAWLSGSSINRNSFDASVDRLGQNPMDPGSGGGFVPIGGTGLLRGQLIWNTSADLDLHLILPDGQEVFFANRVVTFNGGRATAELDQDNLGGTIDVPPTMRVENIVVNGSPSAGNYSFFVFNFNSSGASDAFTLTVGQGSSTQTVTGTLGDRQSSTPVVVPFTPGR
jgi:hypothetical protein